MPIFGEVQLGVSLTRNAKTYGFPCNPADGLPFALLTEPTVLKNFIFTRFNKDHWVSELQNSRPPYVRPPKKNGGTNINFFY